MHDLRPFQPADRPAIVAFQNKRRPWHLQETAAEWERGDALRPPEEVCLRLCVGEPAIAYLNAVDQGTCAWCQPSVCGLEIWVAQKHQRQGIGGALYEKALEFARTRGLTQVKTYVRLCQPDEPAVPFLEKRGFVEEDRIVLAILNVTAFDPSAFARPELERVRLLSLAEAGDTEANRRKVWALDGVIHRDIPTNDVLPKHPPFEHWAKEFDGPGYDPRAVVIAENSNGKWVGLSVLGFLETTNIGWTHITGVLPDYRGKGIAFALKLRAIDAALARGCPLIKTENHENNAPMRTINHKLGFVPDVPSVSYRKGL